MPYTQPICYQDRINFSLVGKAINNRINLDKYSEPNPFGDRRADTVDNHSARQ